jgi:hypothetical protein
VLPPRPQCEIVFRQHDDAIRDKFNGEVVDLFRIVAVWGGKPMLKGIMPRARFSSRAARPSTLLCVAPISRDFRLRRHFELSTPASPLGEKVASLFSYSF